MAGLVPSRRDRAWEYQTFAQGSSTTYVKGSLLVLNGARDVVEYNQASSHSQILGIAMHDSSNTLPTGKCLVAVPLESGARFWADLNTGMTASQLSLGQAYGISKSVSAGTTPTSYLTTLATSVWSRLATIVGPVDSKLSRVECTFIQNAMVFGSVSSTSLA